MRKLVELFGYTVVDERRLVDFYLHEYDSYDQYREVQIFHNKRKINKIWADEVTLNRVVDIVCQDGVTKKL